MTKLEAPESLKHEHRELFGELRKLAAEKGEVGSAVKDLLAVLEPHFEAEEGTAMPLLGALRPLSEGNAIPEPLEVSSLQARFASEHPRMLDEHRQVKMLAGVVRSAATRAKDRRTLALMDELEHHAAVEEEVFYPAALLISTIMGK
ncbi:MAG: hemerythrin domain-containing protein [Nitrososphaerota archaeon]|nr:hemerythrin domain-containing protein [Nitrososphaerota archaeon]